MKKNLVTSHASNGRQSAKNPAGAWLAIAFYGLLAFICLKLTE
jgi:hypothetical protein